MKKQNNRFRNGNNGNSGYTLNYKFDSVSIAGKISGTALDLIRRYNDLAKEAQGSGDYVEMEIYRQYAEHYRKIVTDINERRQTRFEYQNRAEDTDNLKTENADTEVESDSTDASAAEDKSVPAEAVAPNGYVETLPANEPVKAFQVVEIKETAASEETASKSKPKRVYRKRATAACSQTSEASEA